MKHRTKDNSWIMVLSQKKENNYIFITNSIYALGVTVCCLVWLFNPFSFSIPEGSIPLIGQASKENVSVGARVKLFYQLVFTGTLLWVVFTWLFHHLYKNYIHSFQQYATGLYYSVPIVPFAYFLLTGVDVEPTLSLLLGVFFIFIIRTLVTNSAFFDESNRAITVSFNLSLGISFLFHILIHFFFGHFNWVQNNAVLLLLLTVCVVQLVLFIVRRLLNEHLIKVLLLTAAGIPLTVFLSIELHILSLEKQWFVIGYKKLFLGWQLCWLAASWLVVKTKRRGLSTFSKRVFAASLIFGFTLLIFYEPIINAKEELFELANPANSVMRVLQFGEIAMLDFMSSHMFSEQWYGLLYQAVFGTGEQVDFTVYAFLNVYLYYLLIYLILVRVGLNSAGAIIFIFFFPVPEYIIFSYMSFVFLALFTIQRFINSSTVRNAFLLFFLLFILVLWRIDTGAAAIFSTLIFFPLYVWLTRKSFATSTFIKGFGLFLAFLLAAAILALILRPWSYLYENFLSALHYIKGSQAHGYAELFNGSYHQFYVYHFLFTAAAIVLTGIAIYIIRNEKLKVNERKNSWLVFSVFAFILFIANAQRGLVRHGFAEQNEIYFFSTFYLGIAFFVVHFIRNKNEPLKYTLFFSVLFFTFIATKYFPFFPDKLNTAAMINPETFKSIKFDLARENYDGRVRHSDAFKERVYGDIKSYMNRHLASNETFLDFSNTPILYYYCERNVPGYFNQILQNSIDDDLQRKLIASIDKQAVPLVVYSSYPPTWFDGTDGVLNTVRYYQVAEYIFEHYQPLGVLNNHSIWGLKDQNWEEIAVKDSIVTQCIDLNLGYLAGFEGNKYVAAGMSLKDYSVLLEKTLLVSDTGGIPKMEIEDKVLSNNSVSLMLKVDSEEKMTFHENKGVVVFRDSNEREVHRVSFVRDDNQFPCYVIRLSNHYFWHHNNTLTVEFLNIAGLEKALLIKER